MTTENGNGKVPASAEELLVRPGERIVSPPPERSLARDRYRIGLVKYRVRLYASIKLPEEMWREDKLWIQVLARGKSIAAFLVKKVEPGSPQDEIYSVLHLAGSKYLCPCVNIMVSSASKMKGNRYPKYAPSSAVDGGWTRVDVPPSVDLRVNI